MLRLLADENFNGNIVRGALRRDPGLNIAFAQDVGLSGLPDPRLLAHAAHDQRILLTHDRSTMPNHAYERLAAGEPMAGVFIIARRFPIGLAIKEILLLNECSEQADWSGRVIALPL
jgi:hypothetical protein